MSNPKPSLRFDHREVAVLFSLFIFVSLLMFTVGILVGKGLSHNTSAPVAEETHASHEEEAEEETEHAKPAHEPEKHAEAKDEEEHHVDAHAEAPKKQEVAKAEPAKAEKPPLDLQPKTPQVDLAGASLKEPSKTSSTDALLQNPKIRSLIDETPAGKEEARAVASIPPVSNEKPPATNLSAGAYTVQVGSYPSKREATERVEKLKKVGFPHAFFSAKKLMGSQETWYRVWLGYFAEEAGAQKSAEWLQKRGEVKNYLVRRSGAEK